jgi:hypothetical protein
MKLCPRQTSLYKDARWKTIPQRATSAPYVSRRETSHVSKISNKIISIVKPTRGNNVSNLFYFGMKLYITEELNATRFHLLLYYAYVRLNMFRAPLCPSSKAHDHSAGYHIGRLVL